MKIVFQVVNATSRAIWCGFKRSAPFHVAEAERSRRPKLCGPWIYRGRGWKYQDPRNTAAGHHTSTHNHRTRETNKPPTSREAKDEGRVFSLGKPHPLAALNFNHDSFTFASQTSTGPGACGLCQGCSERRIEPTDDRARSSDTGSGGKGTHR